MGIRREGLGSAWKALRPGGQLPNRAIPCRLAAVPRAEMRLCFLLTPTGSPDANRAGPPHPTSKAAPTTTTSIAPREGPGRRSRWSMAGSRGQEAGAPARVARSPELRVCHEPYGCLERGGGERGLDAAALRGHEGQRLEAPLR